MTEKTKKVLVITAGSALCLALAAGVWQQFGGYAPTPSVSAPAPVQDTKEPVVDLQNTEPTMDTPPVTDIRVPDKAADPVMGAVSTGTEQTIQADPIKPEAPKKPAAPGAAPLPDEHGSEDVPQEDRNTEAPPSYQPEQTTVTPMPKPDTQGGYDQGGTYVDGFGYIPSGGEGAVIHDDKIYENGNKVGSMD